MITGTFLFISVLCSQLLHPANITHLLQLTYYPKEVQICSSWRSELLNYIGKMVIYSNALSYMYFDVSVVSHWPCSAPMYVGAETSTKEEK